MVNGKFRCLGSPQLLKNKFGEGYTLIAQLAPIPEPTATNRSSIEMGRRHSSIHSNSQAWEKQLVPLKKFIEDSFPGIFWKGIRQIELEI